MYGTTLEDHLNISLAFMKTESQFSSSLLLVFNRSYKTALGRWWSTMKFIPRDRSTVDKRNYFHAVVNFPVKLLSFHWTYEHVQSQYWQHIWLKCYLWNKIILRDIEKKIMMKCNVRNSVCVHSEKQITVWAYLNML